VLAAVAAVAELQRSKWVQMDQAVFYLVHHHRQIHRQTHLTATVHTAAMAEITAEQQRPAAMAVKAFQAAVAVAAALLEQV
jgi:ubiquinone biosynthesis protein Coq4